MGKKKPKYWYNTKIPAELFFDILESGQLKDLIISGKPKVKELQKAWTKIFDEYFKIKDDGKLRIIIKTKSEILKLTLKISVIENTLKILSIGKLPKENVVKITNKLKSINVFINPEKPINKQVLQKLKTTVAGLKTRLAIEEDNIKKLGLEAKSSFEADCVNIESALGRSINESVTLKKYLEYAKAAKKISNNRRASNNRRKSA